MLYVNAREKGKRKKALSSELFTWGIKALSFFVSSLSLYNHLQLVITMLSPIPCPLCKSTVEAKADHCPTCGFPVHDSSIGTEDFKKMKELESKKRNDAKNSVMLAQTILAVMALLTFLLAGLLYERYEHIFHEGANDVKEEAIVMGLISLSYVALTIVSIYKTLPALVIGFALYLTFLVITGIIDPYTVTTKLVWKIAIFFVFIKGIHSVATMKIVEEELDYWKKKNDQKL
jgi:predicted nucleic acid-binding Zn ribbon protein